MEVYGQLVKAQLENIAATSSTPAARGRIYANTTDTANIQARFHDGTGWVDLLKRRMTTRTVTTTATLAATDQFLYCNANGGAFTVNLPAAATVTGMIFRLWKTDSTFNAVTLEGDGAEQINGAANVKLCTRDEWVDIISTGSGWTIIDHDFYRGKTAWTPTGSWLTNCTYTGFWWRTGNRINFEIRIALTGAPTAASLTITLPTGVTIDTAQILSTSTTSMAFPGRVELRDEGTDNFQGMVRYGSTTTLAIFRDDGDGTNSVVNATAPFTFANTDAIGIHVTDIPATDWLAA